MGTEIYIEFRNGERHKLYFPLSLNENAEFIFDDQIYKVVNIKYYLVKKDLLKIPKVVYELDIDQQRLVSVSEGTEEIPQSCGVT